MQIKGRGKILNNPHFLMFIRFVVIYTIIISVSERKATGSENGLNVLQNREPP